MSLRKGLAAGTMLLAAASGQARAEVLNRWVQYGASNDVLVRSISDASDGSCPSLAIDGAPVQMTQRFAPSTGVTGVTAGATQDQSFPVLMCEADLPLGGYKAKVATIGGVALKMPVANPQRILVIGDTGCRVLGSAIQSCNDPVAFPLNYVSTYAAVFKPDMIVHTGDFYYREAPCPAGDDGSNGTPNCAGSPYGENWTTWNADWFTPAKVLLQTAPWAISRGNHESCDRGARGWFHLLDVRPYSEAAVNCGPSNPAPGGGFYTSYRSVTTTNPEPMPRDPNDTTPAYVVQAGPIALIMFDISYANDGIVQHNLDATYSADLNRALGLLNGKPAFFVAHKPSYGLNNVGAVNSDGQYASVGGGDANGQVVFGSSVPSSISLFLSGHTHNFEVTDFANPAFAPQLVIGNSGTLLDALQVNTAQVTTASPQFNVVTGATGAGTAGSPEVSTFAQVALTQILDKQEFGFAVLDELADQSGYVANIYTLSSARAGRCTIKLSPRSMTCAAF
jgi:hypothetical protein